jgi:hypothetical protein
LIQPTCQSACLPCLRPLQRLLDFFNMLLAIYSSYISMDTCKELTFWTEFCILHLLVLSWCIYQINWFQGMKMKCRLFFSSYKHSSLFFQSISDKEKTFMDIDARACSLKPFATVNFASILWADALDTTYYFYPSLMFCTRLGPFKGPTALSITINKTRQSAQWQTDVMLCVAMHSIIKLMGNVIFLNVIILSVLMPQLDGPPG